MSPWKRGNLRIEEVDPSIVERARKAAASGEKMYEFARRVGIGQNAMSKLVARCEINWPRPGMTVGTRREAWKGERARHGADWLKKQRAIESAHSAEVRRVLALLAAPVFARRAAGEVVERPELERFSVGE